MEPLWLLSKRSEDSGFAASGSKHLQAGCAPEKGHEASDHILAQQHITSKNVLEVKIQGALEPQAAWGAWAGLDDLSLKMSVALCILLTAFGQVIFLLLHTMIPLKTA